MHGTDQFESLPPAAVPHPLQDAGGTVRWQMLASETAIAFTVDSSTYAVMMATPEALDDFALGFCLMEGVVRLPTELLGLQVVPRPQGIELRLDLASPARDRFWQRQRRLRGPLGCGLCGIQSLEAALEPGRRVAARLEVQPSEITAAMAALADAQPLHHLTHSLHAAGFWRPGQGLLAVREDVGRHNALDKLAGALSRQGIDPSRGMVVMTSRLSLELVQKAAALGTPALVGISAPTALAVQAAAACNLTLIGCARNGDHACFTMPR